jgi:N-acetylglutamate synthase-like GNAT family acetyltransferase
MDFTVRQARREDAQQMLQVYNNFILTYVGSASRTVKSFTRILRRKDHLNWVALDKQYQVVGYLFAWLDKRTNSVEIREIVVDPEHDFESMGKLLVERASAAFIEKKVSMIEVGSLRNPAYERLFLELGFLESESNDVFMYAIMNVPKFLNEISEVFISRLKPLQNWNGLVQIDCEGHGLYLEKNNAGVQQIVWTNQPVSFKVEVTRELLMKLLFGLVNPVESHRRGQLKLETAESSVKANRLLRVLFPEKQFLIMDHW